jgi:hypothetical protein
LLAVAQELAGCCVIYECESVWNFLENAKFFTKKYEKKYGKNLNFLYGFTHILPRPRDFDPCPAPTRPGNFDPCLAPPRPEYFYPSPAPPHPAGKNLAPPIPDFYPFHPALSISSICIHTHPISSILIQFRCFDLFSSFASTF